jgi:hypothetical protein
MRGFRSPAVVYGSVVDDGDGSSMQRQRGRCRPCAEVDGELECLNGDDDCLLWRWGTATGGGVAFGCCQSAQFTAR